MKITYRSLTLAMALLAVGCGGRTALRSSEAQNGGAGGTVQPRDSGGQGGRGDAAQADASTPRDAREVGAREVMGADLPDAPADTINSGPDQREPRPDSGADGTVDGNRDSLDVPPDGNRDLPADGLQEKATEGSAETSADLSRDSGEAGIDLPPEARPDELPPRDGGPEARGPGLYVLAGVLAGPGGLDGVGPEAGFYFPSGVAADGAGNLYVADGANNIIRKIVIATGAVTTVAGTLAVEGGLDGVGPNASFYSPQGLATDGAGNLYIASNSRIRKLVVATGEVTTVAGSGLTTYQDGRGRDAGFESPLSLAYDGDTSLFAVDINGTVRKIDLMTTEVSTVAGSATESGSSDATGTAARFNRPQGIAWDGAGNLYVADTDNHTIRKIIVATGVVTTIAGSPGWEGTDDGVGAAARFSYPRGLAADGQGNLLVADVGSGLIRTVALATGAVTTLAGDSENPEAGLSEPDYVAWSAGTLFISDSANHTIRMLATATKQLTTLAGRQSSTGSADGVGPAARFAYPQGLVADGAGNLLVADTVNQTLRKLDPSTGMVTTLAGLAETGGSEDGVGAEARFNQPVALAYDGSGVVYVADQLNSTIREVVLATATVTTLAGSAGQVGASDGIGEDARFDTPAALALDGSGNLFVADKAANTIRKVVLATRNVSTLAGTPGISDHTDGVGAAASFSMPAGLAADGSGNLFVADTGNCTIRRIVIATADTTTVAGSAGTSGADDGTGVAVRFAAPAALALDGSGNLLIADAQSNTVRKMNLSTRAVTTVIGHVGRWETVPGPLPAYIASPSGLAVLPAGALAITEGYENAVLIAQF